jgi:hypothetical protein
MDVSLAVEDDEIVARWEAAPADKVCLLGGIGLSARWECDVDIGSIAIRGSEFDPELHTIRLEAEAKERAPLLGRQRPAGFGRGPADLRGAMRFAEADAEMVALGAEMEKLESSLDKGKLDKIAAQFDRAEDCLENSPQAKASSAEQEMADAIGRRFDGLADEVCGCLTLSCAQPVSQRMLSSLDELREEERVSDVALSRATNPALERAVGCMEKLQ